MLIQETYRSVRIRRIHCGMGPDLSTDLFSGSHGSSSTFNGNFASLPISGILASVQSDVITYGSTPLATAGNTSTTVLTLSGSLATTPVPILVKATNTLAIGAGASFDISFNGGSSFTQTIVPAAGTPVALNAPASGLSIAWAAGTSVTNDTWKAVKNTLTDTTGNGNNFIQVTVGRQALVDVGFNGFPSLLYDGVDDLSAAAGFTLPQAGTTPTTVFAVLQILGSAVAAVSPPTAVADFISIKVAAGPNITASNGTDRIVTLTTGIWSRLRAHFSASAGDVMRWGGAQTVGSAGNNAQSAGRVIGAFGNAAFPTNMRFIQMMWVNHVATAPEAASYDSAVDAKYGAGAIAL